MRTRTKKGLIAAAVLPGILLFTACKSDATVSIANDGQVNIVWEMDDTQNQFAGLMTCADLESEMSTEEFGTVETLSTDRLHCRMTINSGSEETIDGETLIDNGDSFTFIMSGDEASSMGMDPDVMPMEEFIFTVEMPGDIINATGNPQIDGNRAIYTDINTFMQGIEVTGAKTGNITDPTDPTEDDTTDGTGTEEITDGDTTTDNGDGSGDATEPATVDTEDPRVSNQDTDSEAADVSDDDSDDDGGLPLIAWIGIGLGVLALIGLGIWAAMRGKNNRNNQNYGGYPGQPGGYSGQPNYPGNYNQPAPGSYPASQGGQPQYGAQPNQGGFGNQPQGQPGQSSQPNQGTWGNQNWQQPGPGAPTAN